MLHAVTQGPTLYSISLFPTSSSPFLGALEFSGCFSAHLHTGEDRTCRSIPEGFDGPGLEMSFVPSHIHWLELSHMVTPDYKEAGKDHLAVCAGGRRNGFWWAHSSLCHIRLLGVGVSGVSPLVVYIWVLLLFSFVNLGKSLVTSFTSIFFVYNGSNIRAGLRIKWVNVLYTVLRAVPETC